MPRLSDVANGQRLLPFFIQAASGHLRGFLIDVSSSDRISATLYITLTMLADRSPLSPFSPSSVTVISFFLSAWTAGLHHAPSNSQTLLSPIAAQPAMLTRFPHGL